MSTVARIFYASCVSIFLGLMVILIARCQSHVQVKPSVDNMQKQIHALHDIKGNFIIMPGQVSLVRFPYFGPFKFENLRCNKQDIPFSILDGQAIAYVVLSYFAKDNFQCEFRFGESSEAMNSLSIGQFTVNEFKYRKEFLRVDHKKAVLSLKNKKRIADEKQMLAKIFEQSEKNLLFNEHFSAPLTSKITSIFGTKRVFNNQVETEHLGTDYRAQIGTKIFSANSGRVVFAGDLFYGGKTIFIDHGLGIFTCYCHLSQIFVKVGELITKETLLGLSGMTGRVNGPHLHWGVNVHGNWADGHSLIKASRENFPHIPQVTADVHQEANQ